jgi:hypothetical protein
MCTVSSFASDGYSIPWREEGFSRNSLTQNTSSFQLLNPQAFHMDQSYSMSYFSSGHASQTSGLYLNTLSYQFGIPLTLSLDLGMHNVFSSSFNSAYGEPVVNDPGFILPRIGLEYQPTENLLVGVHLFNMQDAYKAYGPWGYSPYRQSPFRRTLSASPRNRDF